MKRALVLSAGFLFAVSGFSRAADEKAVSPKEDQKVWKVRNSKGAVVRTEHDTNGDGKPDSYNLMVQGRQVMLREDDKNFDGQIDSRRLVEWATINAGPGMPPIPGYRNARREQDTDFDGKVDVYVERGKKEAPPGKIGSPMDPNVTPIPEEEPESGSPVQRLVDDRNERYGLNK